MERISDFGGVERAYARSTPPKSGFFKSFRELLSMKKGKVSDEEIEIWVKKVNLEASTLILRMEGLLEKTFTYDNRKKN